MKSKPTLGHPTRTAAVLALRKAGLSTGDIAARIGIESNAVTALENSAARSKSRAVEGADEQVRAIVLPLKTLAALRGPAERRGIAPNRLAQLIVQAAIDSDIIDAVLDDADTDYAPLRRGRVDG